MGELFAAAHYEMNNYVPSDTFLEDAEYGRALDTLVKGCADVILTNGELGKVLILKRIVHPLEDWWCVGGRMKAGETPAEAAARNVRRELGISLVPQRFKFLCHASLLWQYRQQEPKGMPRRCWTAPPICNGTADITQVFTAALSAEEREAISFDKAEYAQAQWVDPASVIQSNSYHTFLRRAMQHIAVRSRYEELHEAIDAGADDAEVAKRARIANQAQKALVDIDRRPHAAVRAYGSSHERDLLIKASTAAKAAIEINARSTGLDWVYKSLGLTA